MAAVAAGTAGDTKAAMARCVGAAVAPTGSGEASTGSGDGRRAAGRRAHGRREGFRATVGATRAAARVLLGSPK